MARLPRMSGSIQSASGPNHNHPGMTHRAWWQRISTSAAVIAAYFLCSISLTFFQKQVVQKHTFPITIVLCHLIMKFVFASGFRSIYTWYTAKSRVTLPWGVYLRRISGIAAASAFDIGLSQWGLEFVTVTLYTMTKSSSILFILFFSVIFKLEQCNVYLPAITLAIGGGLFLFVYQSTQFHLFGFTLCLIASFMSGARWTISQKVVQKSQLGLSHPIDMIYHIQPLMILCILPLSVFFEGADVATSQEGFRFQSYNVIVHLAGLVFFGGTLAFVMEAFEYLVLAKTSSLTLSIIGVVKELTSIFVDQVFMSHNQPLSAINWLGMTICVLGILIHLVNKSKETPQSMAQTGLKARAYRRHNRRDLESEYGLPLLSDDSGDLSSDEDFFSPNLPVSRSDSNLKGASNFKNVGEEFFLRENRTWTSVRDSHLLMKGLDTDDERTVPDILLDKNEIQKAQVAKQQSRNDDVLLSELDFLDSD
ncbi:hypothetical protein TCAL_10555 [Tigriopus californicus]|uniref:Sugar phosphate transporter domain-containing protein n=1 Tax=Tigriopus californicus TaxID=6832 RepID=A0A553N775_TIGCA|nr:solute carrier family 35 member C2-like [Tigriopus californicus]TRY61288.1 hypothetical protein TCAL_10555 [Tigriopus californicus]|eukprot:TCALIF_10555-PA protein Name:"Similar to SLC35C2 Solute carrier family 35 member C2 (Homo sapiens)" AED:0.01 eAED:0.01 QI:47/0.75/0.8/1/0.75/0.8/5/244/478